MNDLESGLGGAIAVMAAEVDRLERAIRAARDEATAASERLADEIETARRERAIWDLRQRIGADRATVIEIAQDFERLLDNSVAFGAFDMRDEADATCVVFVARIIKALNLRKTHHKYRPALGQMTSVDTPSANHAVQRTTKVARNPPMTSGMLFCNCAARIARRVGPRRVRKYGCRAGHVTAWGRQTCFP